MPREEKKRCKYCQFFCPSIRLSEFGECEKMIEESLEDKMESDRLYFCVTQKGKNTQAYALIGKDYICIHWKEKENEQTF